MKIVQALVCPMQLSALRLRANISKIARHVSKEFVRTEKPICMEPFYFSSRIESDKGVGLGIPHCRSV